MSEKNDDLTKSEVASTVADVASDFDKKDTTTTSAVAKKDDHDSSSRMYMMTKATVQKTGIVLYQFAILYPLLIVRKTLSVMLSGIGFLVNTTREIYQAVFTNNQYFQWKAALARLELYLKDSGISDEVENAINERFLTNMSVIDDTMRDVNQNRQQDTRMIHTTVPSDLPTMEQAAHFMRYSTAVYGPEVIGSAVVECNDPEDYEAQDRAMSMNTQDQILAYCRVRDKEQDSVVMHVDTGGSMDYLNHFVVVDHVQKALVIAIRGTFTVSGLMTDLVAMTEPYCGGEAHAGIAEAARATWNKSKDVILEKLKTLPKDYDVVLTGHSLGAGAACLMTILIYHEKAIETNRKVRCMAYAPPPVFFFPSSSSDDTNNAAVAAAARDAMNNTIAYVHSHDCVPFLSVHAMRHFFSILMALDTITRHMWTYEKILIDWDVRRPTRAMIDAVRAAQHKPMPTLRGAAQVRIPAKAIVWLKLMTDEKKIREHDKKLEKNKKKKGRIQHADSSLPKPVYVASVSDPKKVSNLSILIHPYMISDHFPAKYEAGLRNATLELHDS